jgi:hypothetical protein
MKNKTTIGRTLFALAMVISLTSTLATTASADEWRDHERDAHEWHHHHMHRHHDQPVVVEQPNVVYAPPVVIQAPVADSGSSGFNVTIPINFR